MLHDITNMSEEQKKMEYLARLETNLVYVFFDVLESLWIECENINRKCGYQMRHEEKRYYNAMMANLRKLRGVTRQIGKEEQEQFGEDADMTLDLLYAAVTRTGKDNFLMCRFLEYMMAWPDKLGLDSVRHGSEAFEGIKKKLGI